MKGEKGSIKTKTKAFFEVKNLIVIALILLSVIFMLTHCEIALSRLFTSVKDFGINIAYWFVDSLYKLDVFQNKPQLVPIVTDLPDVDYESFLPFDIDELQRRFEALPRDLFDLDLLSDYNYYLFFLAYQIIFYSLIFFLIFVIIFLICGDLITDPNEKENGSLSKGYNKLLRFFYKRVKPVFISISDFVKYLWKKTWALLILAVTWLVALNIFSFLIEFFAWYFYFIASFDIFSLPTYILKIIVDLAIMLDTLHPVAWIVIFVTFFAIWSVATGLERLRHGEAKNCGVIKALNLLILIVGEMGLGKTALATDIALSANNVQKADGHEIMYKYDLLFPLFSWELFEKDVQEGISSGKFYNLPSIDKYIAELQSFYDRNPCLFCKLYNYDFQKYPMLKDIGTKEISLFDAMREYAKAYFVYTCDNPNLANYSIRLDGYHDDSPFFKKWCGDFFRPNKEKSKFCHILDQDIMRLGKLVEPENPLAGSFGFGIYNNTEWGKSRLNQVNSEGIKKEAEEANQKNDLYDYLVKLVRHASLMIDNKVFFRFIADEQRPESIPASLRDVVTVVNIKSKSELRNALPGFFIFDWIYDMVYEPIKDFYYKYRNNRGDRTAPILIIKAIVSVFSNFYEKAYNNFGYFDLELETESGRAYGNQGDSVSGAVIYNYQLAVKKIYSERYSTDCYQQFFEKKQLESSFGINQYPTYSSLKMTVEEMLQQHDYFLMEIMDIMHGEKDAPEASAPAKKTKTTKKKDTFEGIVFQ